MKNTIFAMVFSAILGLGAAGCGSSNSSDKGDTGAGVGAGGAGGGGTGGTATDAMGKVCDRLEACGTTSTAMAGMTTAAECKQYGNTMIGKVGAGFSDTITAALNGCLAKTDCTEFTTCMQSLATLMPATH
jgi:hypothetical protein